MTTRDELQIPAAARVRQWSYGAFLFLVVARRTIVTCEQTYVRNMVLSVIGTKPPHVRGQRSSYVLRAVSGSCASYTEWPRPTSTPGTPRRVRCAEGNWPSDFQGGPRRDRALDQARGRIRRSYNRRHPGGAECLVEFWPAIDWRGAERKRSKVPSAGPAGRH